MTAASTAAPNMPNRGHWQRILVPDQEQTVSVLDYDPGDRHLHQHPLPALLRADDQGAPLRSGVPLKTCSADQAKRAELATQQQSIRAALPPVYNEKLVYRCAAAGRIRRPAGRNSSAAIHPRREAAAPGIVDMEDSHRRILEHRAISGSSSFPSDHFGICHHAGVTIERADRQKSSRELLRYLVSIACWRLGPFAHEDRMARDRGSPPADARD
jgi:hypothetical protein